MNDVVANDAILVAQQASSLSRQLFDLYQQIKNHRQIAEALGIVFNGTLDGVPASGDTENVEYQFTQFISYMESGGGGVLTVYLKGARIGGGPNQLG